MSKTQVVVAERRVVTVVTAGVPVSVGGESDVPYAVRTDIASDTVSYRGEAAPGASEASAVWRIRRFTIATDGDVTEQWADGDARFDNAWSGRAGLSYS